MYKIRLTKINVYNINCVCYEFLYGGGGANIIYTHTYVRVTYVRATVHTTHGYRLAGGQIIYLHHNWTRPMAACVTTPLTVHITIRDSRGGGGTALVLTLLFIRHYHTAMKLAHRHRTIHTKYMPKFRE